MCVLGVMGCACVSERKGVMCVCGCVCVCVFWGDDM